MRMYVIAFATCIAVCAFYGCLGVRSPAPPVVALVHPNRKGDDRGAHNCGRLETGEIRGAHLQIAAWSACP